MSVSAVVIAGGETPIYASPPQCSLILNLIRTEGYGMREDD